MRFTHALQKRGCLFYLGLGAALAFLVLLTLASFIMFAPGIVLSAARLLPSGDSDARGTAPNTTPAPATAPRRPFPPRR